MAISYDSGSSSINWDTGTTYSHTTGVGASILILVMHGTKYPNTAKYAGVNFTTFYNNAFNSNTRVSILYLLNPPAGTNNVVVTADGGTNNNCGTISLFGVGSVDTPVSGENTGSSAGGGVEITLNNSNSWTCEFHGIVFNPTATITQTSGQTARLDQIAGNFNMTFDLCTDEFTSPGPTTQNFSNSPNVESSHIVAFELIDFNEFGGGSFLQIL
jgi:hypothetical protein